MENTTYSANIADVIRQYLYEHKWNFFFNEEEGFFKFGVALDGKIKKVNCILDVREDSYFVMAFSPIGADASDSKAMSTMAEFICRANYGLIDGNFELDMDDGEIRYKCFVPCDGIVPTSDMIESSLLCPAEMFECYGDGILGIVSGGLTAKEAVEKCENDPEDMLTTMFTEGGIGDDGRGVEGMFGRFEERLGGADLRTAGVTDESDMSMEIKIQLFGNEGGAE